MRALGGRMWPFSFAEGRLTVVGSRRKYREAGPFPSGERRYP